MFVIDASVAASWAFPDEDAPAAQSAFRRLGADTATTPALFWFELRNVLLVGERRGRVTPTKIAQFLKFLGELPIVVDREPDENAVLALARAHKLSVYDTAYLELAQRKGLPLATLDTALIKAARSEKTMLIEAL
jgi:predicted nucleic acid-binding protein